MMTGEKEITLLETLSLALALEVNLELREGRVYVTPIRNLTPELRGALKAHNGALKEHLRMVEEEEGYKLISDIVSAGVALEYDEKRNLTGGNPAEAIDIALEERIKKFKPWISGIKKARERGIKSEAEFILMARERFPDREPYERPLSKEEFFYGERKRLGESA